VKISERKIINAGEPLDPTETLNVVADGLEIMGKYEAAAVLIILRDQLIHENSVANLRDD
jgi:hypothetical protein